MKYDIGIIGAGPAGYSAAFKAVESGKSVVIFEQDKVGGTCLNRGCIPTKSLLHTSGQYSLIRKAVPDYPFDYQKALETRDSTVTQLRNGIEKMIKMKKITLVNGHACIVDPHHIKANGEDYEVDYIIIATGSKVSLPPINGIDSEYVITSDDLLEKNDLNFDSVTIIGGGVIGVECASIFLALDKKVTILEIADHILPTMDPEMAQRLNMFLKKKKADIQVKVSIRNIEGNTINYVDARGRELSVTSDKILVAAGRRANWENLFSEELKLETGRGIIGDQYGRTNIDNIFVAGDVKDRNIQLAHVAIAQGENIIDIINGQRPAIDTSVIPSCIYTDPEMASVGLSQKEAELRGMKVSARKVLTGANGKALIEESESGYVKVVLDESEVIIGAQLICPHATELVSELSLCVQKKLTLSQLKEVIHPHPTVSEMIAGL